MTPRSTLRGKLPFTLGVLAVALLVAGVFTAGTTIAHTSTPGQLEFHAKNDRYEAHGHFERWRLTEVEIPDGDLEQGTVTFEVDLASVREKSPDLAEHLRQPDFFDVGNFAISTVTVHDAEKQDDGTYTATATVDLHGVTEDVPATFEVVNESPLEIKGEATLLRLAFGVGAEGNIENEVKVVITATLESGHHH